ncbi:MAG TPA: imelysin family protein [Polyangiaceae bacterium]|nr:imelysin family protein [Polyangiaceae bacterium]
MQRRSLLRLGALSAFALVGAPGCARPIKREDVLSRLVRDVAVPELQATLKASERLSSALSALGATPTLTSLSFARAAFAQCLLAWKRAQCFKNGPIVDTNALVRATFWPPRTAAAEALMNGNDPIDQHRVDSLGVDVKGLYTLEYVLFPAGLGDDAALALLSSQPGRRRLVFATVLATSVLEYVRRAADAMGDGDAFAKRFAEGGKQSMSRVVGQLISSVEALAISRLGAVLGLSESRLLKPTDIEGAPSHLSSQIVASELAAVSRIYHGEGRTSLAGLVESLSRPIAARIDSSLSEAERAVAALKAPLEVEVSERRPAVEAALKSVKALERALKVDLASTLGITLTFQAGDGD